MSFNLYDGSSGVFRYLRVGDCTPLIDVDELNIYLNIPQKLGAQYVIQIYIYIYIYNSS